MIFVSPCNLRFACGTIVQNLTMTPIGWFACVHYSLLAVSSAEQECFRTMLCSNINSIRMASHPLPLYRNFVQKDSDIDNSKIFPQRNSWRKKGFQKNADTKAYNINGKRNYFALILCLMKIFT